MIGFKVFVRYFGYWITFSVVACIMLIMLIASVMGVTAGVMMVIFGIAVLMFKADFVITELPAPVMLFGGLSCGFIAASVGLIAVKLGFALSRLFIRVRRRCDRLRGWH